MGGHTGNTGDRDRGAWPGTGACASLTGFLGVAAGRGAQHGPHRPQQPAGSHGHGTGAGPRSRLRGASGNDVGTVLSCPGRRGR